MPWTPVQAAFSGNIGALMSNAQQGMRDVGRVAGQYLDRVAAEDREKRRQMESDRAFGLQKAADDRAQTEYDRINKERENIITASNIISQLPSHLSAKDTSAVTPDMGSILSQPTGTGQVSYDGAGAGGTIRVPYAQKVQQGTVGDPSAVDVPFKYITKDSKPPEVSVLKSRNNKLYNNIIEGMQFTDPDGNLIDNTSLYKSIPFSSARVITPKGEALLRDFDKRTNPEDYQTLNQSTFKSLDMNNIFTKDGKPAGKDVPFDQQYVMDTKNNKLVSMNVAKAAEQKQQQGIEQASVPNYVNKTGYKDVPINSGKLMTQFTSKGYAPDQVQAVTNDVSGRYQKLLSMLPSDNSARREELTQYANMVVSNLGIDPRAFDTKAYVDRLLPKTEMSEAQKVGFNTLIHGLDRELDQANKNRGFSLEDYKMKTDIAFKNAELGLRKMQLQQEKEAKFPAYDVSVKLKDGGITKIHINSREMEAAVDKMYGDSIIPGSYTAGARPSESGGSGKVDLQSLGGSKLLGGTSGNDLIAISKRMKAQFPNIPMSAIEAEIASNVDKQWFTDSPDANLIKALQQYK